MDAPSRLEGPSWLQNDDFTFILHTSSDPQEVIPALNPPSITKTAWDILFHLPTLMHNWTLSFSRISSHEIEQIAKDLSKELKSILAWQQILVENVNTWSLNESKTKTQELAQFINEVSNKLVLVCKYPLDIQDKSPIISQFIDCIHYLKTHDELAEVWGALTEVSKKIADLAVPYALPPGSLIGENLPRLPLETLSVSFRLPVKLGEGTCYGVKFHSRNVGSITYTLNDGFLTFWQWIVPPRSNDAAKKPHKEFLERIQKTETVFHSRMEEVSYQRLVNLKVVSEDYRESLAHQKYQLVKHYHKTMFASIGFPIELPFRMGSCGEYTITKPFQLTPLVEHLGVCDLATQKNLAYQLVNGLKLEFEFGFHIVKSPAFFSHEEGLYAKDVEDFFIPLTLSEYSEKLVQLKQELRTEYKNYPEFIKEVEERLQQNFNNYVKNTEGLNSYLSSIKPNKTEEEFLRILKLAHLCIEYKINFVELVKTATSPQERTRLLTAEVTNTLKQLSLEDNIFPELHQMFQKGPSSSLPKESTFENEQDFRNALLGKVQHSNSVMSSFVDHQLNQQANLEKLFVSELVLTALQSNRSFSDFFMNRDEDIFNQYLPSEDVPFFKPNDFVKTNKDYFLGVFGLPFLIQLYTQVSEIKRNPIKSLALFYAYQHDIDHTEKYKALLHNHLVKFNQLRKAQDFINQIIE